MAKKPDLIITRIIHGRQETPETYEDLEVS